MAFFSRGRLGDNVAKVLSNLEEGVLLVVGPVAVLAVHGHGVHVLASWVLSALLSPPEQRGRSFPIEDLFLPK